MRHGKKFNHLSRKTAHRKAMLSNMACSLIEHKTINTTLAKAKALRKYVEPILTRSKTDSTHSRRLVFRYLQNKYTVTELFRDVAPKIADRPGGYTRIIRTGYRLGDNAEMCMIELVDFNELYTNEKTKKNTRRSRRGAGSTATTTEETVEATTDAATTEEVVEATTDAASTEEVKVEKVEETKTEAKAEVKPKAEKKTEVKAEKPAAKAKPEAKAEDKPDFV
jgi:large subunit ribosomal protein L17